MKHLKAIYLVLFVWELVKKVVLFYSALHELYFCQLTTLCVRVRLCYYCHYLGFHSLGTRFFLMFFLPCWLILTVLKINGGLPVRSFLWRDSRRNYLLWTYREERASSLNAAGRQTSTVQYSSIFLISSSVIVMWQRGLFWVYDHETKKHFKGTLSRLGILILVRVLWWTGFWLPLSSLLDHPFMPTRPIR